MVGLNFISHNPVDDIVKTLKDLFSEKIGTYKGSLISLPIDPKANLVCCKAKCVPFAGLYWHGKEGVANLDREGTFDY